MHEKYRVLIDDGEVIRFPDGNVLTESELDEVNLVLERMEFSPNYAPLPWPNFELH